MTSFSETHFDTAQEFLEALQITNPHWWDYHDTSKVKDNAWLRNWYFRGQSDAEWSLTPSAWRSAASDNPNYLELIAYVLGNNTMGLPVFKALQDKWPDGLEETDENRNKISNIIWQAVSEIAFVMNFAEFADSLGYRLPDYSTLSKNIGSFASEYINNYAAMSDNRKFWMHPIVALAQHHGISTRLLDWTKNPLKAAFFAALEVVDDPRDSQLIAVFAINSSILSHHIVEVKVPYGENPFLQAQEGIFTFDSQADKHFFNNGAYPSMEESLVNLPSPYKSILPRKYTLKATEAPELMRLLALVNVTQAHLMPTLDNVADAVKTRLRLVGKQASN